MIYRNWRPKYTTHPVSLLLELYTKLYVCNAILGDNNSNRRVWKRHGIIPTEWIERARERRQEGSEASRAGWWREVGRPGAAVSRAARGVVAPLPPLSTATARFLQPRQPFWSPSTQEKCALRLRSLPGHVSQDPDEMSPRQTQTAVRPLPVS